MCAAGWVRQHGSGSIYQVKQDGSGRRQQDGSGTDQVKHDGSGSRMGQAQIRSSMTGQAARVRHRSGQA